MNESIKPLRIGDLIVPYPIIQGGMGVGISLSGLSSAVANCGGIGNIATAGIGMDEPDFYQNYALANDRALRNEIRTARAKSKGILGVNIMVAITNFAEAVTTSIEEGIDIIFSGAGLPMNLPEFLRPGDKTKLVPIVSSGRTAALICKRWLSRYNYLPDAFVLEGPKAGGHLGFKYEHISDPNYSLEMLLPELIKSVKPFNDKNGRSIPIIVAGGIYTGADIHRFLLMGADGVQMGTRFVVTHECDASNKFKQTYIDAKKDDILVIKSPVGLPGRVIRNAFVESINRGEKAPYKCPYHCIHTCDYKNSPYCIAHALVNAKRGNFKAGFAFAGTNAYRATEIISVRELFDILIEEYKHAKMGNSIQAHCLM